MKNILPLLLLISTQLWSQSAIVSLFQPVQEAARSENASALDAHITQYTLLQPDQTVWSNLLAERPQSLTLTLPFEGGLTLELEKTNPLAYDFILTASNASGGTDTLDYQPGLHYSGKIVGEAHSLVAISIFADQMMGVISDANSNINLGRVNTDAARAANVYVMFRDVDLVNPPKLECGTPDEGTIEIPVDYAKPTALKESNLPVNACPIRIFLDCDFGLYLANGSNTSATMNMATANFNVSKTIFANENVGVEISEIHVWINNDPFVNNDKEAALWQFRGYYNPIGINGNIGLVLQPENLGGQAWLDVICNPSWHYGIVGNMTYPAPYPNWTFSAKVMTHELGHSFGSAHTHYCGWPGGAIDNCYATEITCPTCPPCPPGAPPVNGGTIMSYCNQNPPFSIPLSNGFGPMPGWVIRDRAMNAGCIKPLNDINNQPTVCGCTPDPADVQELVNFYWATGGPNWTNKTNWLNFNDYNWYGIRWKNVNGKCRVFTISFGGFGDNNLMGYMPNLSLEFLDKIFLQNNHITGLFPTLNCPNIRNINIGLNELNGPLPNLNLQYLSSLILTGNNFTGTIPNFNLPNLTALELGHNQLTGTIPIFNLPNLERLGLHFNNLEGIIPNFTFPFLKSINLDDNRFSGQLPNFNLPNLESFSINRNSISGNMPNINSPKLISLFMSENLLIGQIPNLNFPFLVNIVLDNNYLSGAIPNFSLPSLKIVDINNNKFLYSGFYQFFPNNFTVFDYFPQAKIPTYTTPNCNSLYVKAGGVMTHNTYKWYKVGTGLVATTVGDSLYTPASAGQYYCEITNSVVTGLTLTSETVQKGSAYVAISGATSFCSGGNTLLNAGSGYASYLWSNGATTQQITANSGGNYSVTVSVAPGCTGTAQATVTSVAYPQPSISSTAPAICTGATPATLNAGSGYGTYLWSNGKTTQNIDVSQPGVYTVTVTNAPGCSGTATYTLNALAAANPVVSGIAPICPGQNLTLNVGSFATYKWSTGSTASSATVNQPGTYTVTVTNAAGCSGTANAIVPNNLLSVSIQGNQQICTGGFTVLDAGSGFISYTWSNGTTTRINEVGAQGSYTVTVTNAQGCSGTAILEVVEAPSPAPFPDIQGATTVCGGNSTTLNAGSGYASYTWNTGSTAQNITVNQSGNYAVTVTDSGGCKGKDAVVVTFGNSPAPQISGASGLCSGTTAILTANAGFQTYLWNTGDTLASITISQSGTYSATVTNAAGCTGSVSWVVDNLGNGVPVAMSAPSGNNQPLPGSTVIYSIAPVSGVSTYTWMPPPGCSINGNPAGQSITLPALSGTSVSASFDCGWGTLCVTAGGTCIASDTSCQDVLFFNGTYEGKSVCSEHPTPGWDAPSACIFSNLDGIESSNTGFLPIGPNGFCGSVQNGAWYAFVPNTNYVKFTVQVLTSINNNGVQLAIADSDANQVVCYYGDNNAAQIPAIVEYDSLTPGKVYYLFIDGFGGDECTYLIQTEPSQLGYALPPVQNIPSIQGPSTVCSSSDMTLTIPPINGAKYYTWWSPNAYINGGWTPSGTATFDADITSATFNFPNVGAIEKVCVWAYNDCQHSDTICKDILVIKEPIYTSLPPKVVCEGEQVTICGETFNETGGYFANCTSSYGCDSTVYLNLTVLKPKAEIVPINCGNGSVSLSSQPSPQPTIKTWKNETGQIVGNGNDLTVTQPGTYILEASMGMFGTICAKKDSIIIDQFDLVSVAANDGELTCDIPWTFLAATSPTPGTSFSWFGPNGAVQAMDTIFSAGTYVVIATNAISGCTASDTAIITAIPTFSVVLQTNLESGGNTCQSTAYPTLGTPPYSYLWSNGQTGQSADNLSGGLFSVTITDAAGCSVIQTSSCVPVSTNGLDAWQVFSARPNPANTNLLVHIRLTNQENLRIQLFNAVGQNLFETTFNTNEIEENIDLSRVLSGCYFLQVSTQSGSKSKLISIVK